MAGPAAIMGRMVAPLFIQAVAVFLATALAAEVEPIASVTALTPTALATRPEVMVRGTVIHIDPILHGLIVEDDSGGVVVDLGAGGTESAEAIAVGDEVEITVNIEANKKKPAPAAEAPVAK